MFLQKNLNNSNEFMQYESFKKALHNPNGKRGSRWPKILMAVIILIMFLPWTQNIQSKGDVSSLNPQQRPQEINSIIPGRIVKWYVKDGDMVKAGDTILQLTEVKDDYLDPDLANRTEEQLNAKSEATQFYKDKARTADAQLNAIEQALIFKSEQIRNKLRQYKLVVKSDSMVMLAAINQLKISDDQLRRQKELYAAGLKSLTELETRQQYYQEALAKKISAENKFYNSRNELLNIQLELSSVMQDYTEKLSKTTGEKFTALSQASTGEADVAKLRNQLFNYRQRRNFHFIIAPQSGQIVQSIKAGIGETVKDGEKLLAIVPQHFDKAIEIDVEPNDLPLVAKGQLVRIQFDGFPAIVFSGWPQASYGLFSGRIVAIDNTIGETGKFKVWVKPDESTKPWPATLKYGTGCKTIALLNNVPLWYELWRQINGFPADFYKKPVSENNKYKKK